MSEKVVVGLVHPVSNDAREFDAYVAEVSLNQVRACCAMRAPDDIAPAPMVVDLVSALFDQLQDDGHHTGPATRGARVGRESKRLFHQILSACRRFGNADLLWQVVEVRCFGSRVNPHTSTLKSIKGCCGSSTDPGVVLCVSAAQLPGAVLRHALTISAEEAATTQSGSPKSPTATTTSMPTRKPTSSIVGSIIHKALEAFRLDDPSASAEAQAFEANIPLTPTKLPTHSALDSSLRTQQSVVDAVLQGALCSLRATSGPAAPQLHTTVRCPSYSTQLGVKRERDSSERGGGGCSVVDSLKRFERNSSSVAELLRDSFELPSKRSSEELLQRYAPLPRQSVVRSAIVPFVVGSMSLHRPNAPQQENYTWSVYLRGVNNVCLSTVLESVVFVLHPSFAHATQVVSKPPYMITEKGWGEFEVAIYLELKHVHAPVFLTKLAPNGGGAPAAGSSLKASRGARGSSSIRSPTTPNAQCGSFPNATATTPAGGLHKVHVKTSHPLRFSHRNCLLLHTLTQDDGADKKLDLVRGAIASSNAERLHHRVANLATAEDVKQAFDVVESAARSGARSSLAVTTMLKDPAFVHYQHCVPPYGLPVHGDLQGFTPFTHLDIPCVYEQRDELVVINPDSALLTGCELYLAEVMRREDMRMAPDPTAVANESVSSLVGAVWATVLQHSPLLGPWRATVTLPVSTKAAQLGSNGQTYVEKARGGAGIGEVGILRLQSRHDEALLGGLRRGVQGETSRLRLAL